MTDNADSASTPTPAEGAGIFLDHAHRAEQPWARLAEHLAAHGMHFAPEPAPQQFAGGFGNLNYLVSVDGVAAVLRRPPAGPLPPGGNDMAREHRVLSRLWRAFPLAPRSLHFCADETVLGAPFFIMDYRPGLVVRGDLPPAVAGRGRELSKMLVDVLTRLHAVDPAAVDLDELGRPAGFLGRAVAGWIKRARVAAADIYDDGRLPAAARDVADWLDSRPPPVGGVSLLHNDYKLDNIILDPAAPTRPLAVLDWDMCTRGDPLFDLATLLSYWVMPDDPPVMHALHQMPTAEGDFLSREQVVARYAEATGRDVSDFLFYRVLAAFKLAVIFQQIYARHCRGTTRDPRVQRLGPLGEGLFAFAHDIARGRAF